MSRPYLDTDLPKLENWMMFGDHCEFQLLLGQYRVIIWDFFLKRYGSFIIVMVKVKALRRVVFQRYMLTHLEKKQNNYSVISFKIWSGLTKKEKNENRVPQKTGQPPPAGHRWRHSHTFTKDLTENKRLQVLYFKISPKSLWALPPKKRSLLPSPWK